MAESNITIEAVVHDAIAEVIQNLSDKFGVKVDSVSFDWVDTSDSNGRHFILRTVRMVTEKGDFKRSNLQ